MQINFLWNSADGTSSNINIHDTILQCDSAKGKVVSVGKHHIKHKKCESKDSCILDLGNSWKWVVRFMLWPLDPYVKSPWYPLARRLRRSIWTWQQIEKPRPCWQSNHSCHFTDWAILSQCDLLYMFTIFCFTINITQIISLCVTWICSQLRIL
jgi:hypothetical protein